jgi:hypothetical protein
MATEPSFLVIKIKPVFGGSGEPGEAQSWVAQGDCMRVLWAKDVIALRARGCAPTGNRRCCSRHHLVTAGSRGGAKNSGMAVASPGRPARGMRRAQRRCDPRAHGRSPPRGGALRNASEQRAAQGRQVRWLRKEDPPTVRRERVWGRHAGRADLSGLAGVAGRAPHGDIRSAAFTLLTAPSAACGERTCSTPCPVWPRHPRPG